MLTSKDSGSIFDEHAEAIVNPVNCVGAACGLAWQFMRKFPEQHARYMECCSNQALVPGTILVCTSYRDDGSRLHVVYFPTKSHWGLRSQLKSIRSGLDALESYAIRAELASLALPALGCRSGKLSWDTEVLPAITEFSELPTMKGVAITAFSPQERG